MLAPILTRAAIGVALALASATSGCGDDHDKPPGGSPGAGGAPEPVVESHTVYTAAVEHFDEHPRLVAGKPAKFAAHATDIRGDASFKAFREGTLAVLALRDGKVVAESAPVKASRPGIFGPVLTVPSPGPVEVRVRLRAPGLEDEASLGEVMVYASEAEAAKVPTADGDGGGEAPITFLKEQQWRIEFRNEEALTRRLVQTLRVPGRVVPRPGGRALVPAPAAGLTLPPSDAAFPKLGDPVTAGDILGTVAPVLGGVEGTQLMAVRAELDVKAIEVETEIERARAKQARAKALLERAERLKATGAASERELEDARFEVALAEADVAAAERLRAPFEAVQKAQAGGTMPLAIPLRAPISGTIVAARATPGEHVEGGRVLFEIVDLASVWLEADVPEVDLARLPARPPASLIPASTPGAAVRSEGVSFVVLGAVIDPETRSARADYSCDTRDGSLRNQAAVDLLIETAAAEDALAIPESAIIDEDGRPVVYVQLEGEAFERRLFVSGFRSGEHVQVLDGLEPGDRVVTKGAYAIRLQSVSTTIPAHGHAH